MDAALDRLLRRTLRPDETLWWSGRPSARRMMLSVAPLSAIGLVVAGCALYVLPYTRLAASLSLAVGTLLALAPALILLATRGMCYAVTSQRLLLVTRWPWTGAKSWEASRLPAFTRVDAADGTGDIRFAGHVRERPMALVGLSDVRTVQRLLENLRSRAVPPPHGGTLP